MKLTKACSCGLEQKIKDRIKQLDEGYPSDIKWSTTNMIDELRKLLK